MANPTPIPPVIDFSLIPEEYQGFWVVIRVGDGERQEILAQGESPTEAMRISQARADDPMIIVTQVPEVPTAAKVPTAARMAHPDER